MFRLLQITPVMCIPVAHRISIQPPCLPASPGRRIVRALVGHFPAHLSRHRIIVHNMKGAIVRPVMILHRRVGMAYRYPVERRVTCETGRLEEQLQVHHIVDDDGKVP